MLIKYLFCGSFVMEWKIASFFFGFKYCVCLLMVCCFLLTLFNSESGFLFSFDCLRIKRKLGTFDMLNLLYQDLSLFFFLLISEQCHIFWSPLIWINTRGNFFNFFIWKESHNVATQEELLINCIWGVIKCLKPQLATSAVYFGW